MSDPPPELVEKLVHAMKNTEFLVKDAVPTTLGKHATELFSIVDYVVRRLPQHRRRHHRIDIIHARIEFLRQQELLTVLPVLAFSTVVIPGMSDDRLRDYASLFVGRPHELAELAQLARTRDNLFDR